MFGQMPRGGAPLLFNLFDALPRRRDLARQIFEDAALFALIADLQTKQSFEREMEGHEFNPVMRLNPATPRVSPASPSTARDRRCAAGETQSAPARRQRRGRARGLSLF